ncbi:MAG TPA: hypothetical protein GXZ85_06735 [Firmicutes bacterium]|nr:hypothetical protein [Bacillota bacterium]
MKSRFFFAVSLCSVLVLAALFCFPIVAGAEDNSAMKVVGLYSETAAGSIRYRVGADDWITVKLGDELPSDAEILINVARDWIELIPMQDATTVYEIRGAKEGEVQVRLSDLAPENARTVRFPEASSDIDPEFANTLVVKEYLGRQHYIMEDGSRQEIKYGNILAVGGSVNIIGINNTLLLALPNGEETTVVGPIKFTVENILKGENLYRYLNVQ